MTKFETEDWYDRIDDVKKIYGIGSDSTVWDWVNRGLLPKPRRIGPRAVGWLHSEILKNVRSRPVAVAKDAEAIGR